MKRRVYTAIAAVLSLGFMSSSALAREGMTISIVGAGNILLVDTKPQLSPGPGGGVSFDYRFNDRFSLEAGVMITTHDGTGSSNGDNGVLLMSLPTVDFKYYVLTDEELAWDPYVGIGVGMYFATEGSQNDNSGGVGLGSQILVGFDYYFSQTISAGFEGVFRSIALITGGNSGQNATAILPYTLMGKVGFHF